MRILVALEPVDFRAGIDALVGVCRQRLASDPFDGALFVFANRRRSAIKILVYDGNGFWLCQKRLSSGKFAYWPDGGRSEPGQRTGAVAGARRGALSGHSRAAAWERLQVIPWQPSLRRQRHRRGVLLQCL
jgi:transposase